MRWREGRLKDATEWLIYIYYGKKLYGLMGNEDLKVENCGEWWQDGRFFLPFPKSQ
jgi:hypothetical protein